ncbi:MAG: acyl-CoA thioesterase [Planctomycetota bacterium]|jgi:acyl-CoA thioester hydrolase
MSSDTIQIRVRYNECDPMNVAHHTAYPVWFEIGRTELLRRTGLTYRDLEADGVFRHEYELSRGRELLATGRTTIACLDRAGNLRPLPEALLAE